jgi:hypothetical protein
LHAGDSPRRLNRTMTSVRWFANALVVVILVGLSFAFLSLATSRYGGIGSILGFALIVLSLALSCLSIVGPWRTLSPLAGLACLVVQGLFLWAFAESYLADARQGDGLAVMSMIALLPLAFGGVAAASLAGRFLVHRVRS